MARQSSFMRSDLSPSTVITPSPHFRSWHLPVSCVRFLEIKEVKNGPKTHGAWGGITLRLGCQLGELKEVSSPNGFFLGGGRNNWRIPPRLVWTRGEPANPHAQDWAVDREPWDGNTICCSTMLPRFRSVCVESSTLQSIFPVLSTSVLESSLCSGRQHQTHCNTALILCLRSYLPRIPFSVLHCLTLIPHSVSLSDKAPK